MASEALHVDQRVEGTAVVVRAVGEVDTATAPLLARQATSAVSAATPPGPLVIDLRAVELLDSAGMATLFDTHQQCLRRGVILRVVAEPALTRRLALVGLPNVVPVHSTANDALHANDDQPTPP